MKIYFVRHGESEANVGPLVQGPDEPLTQNGVKQATEVAERISLISIDTIISSPEVRAKNTAEIISKKINKPVEFNDLLVEFVKPSVIIKRPKKDPLVKEIKKILKDNFHVTGWKHSDEENFEDLKNRAINLLDFLSKKIGENIVVVTHGIFMRMLVAVAIMGRDLTSHEYWKFFVGLGLDNTGITILKSNQIDEKYDDVAPWELVTWNDHSHLS